MQEHINLSNARTYSVSPSPEPVSTHNVEKILSEGNYAEDVYLVSCQDDNFEAFTIVSQDIELSYGQQDELSVLLATYASVFATPTTCVKRHDHKIPLLEGTKHPSARSYRYGPLQKTEIEKRVKELLVSRFI